MIADFDDFVTWMHVLTDDIWQLISPLYPYPGTKPGCSDSELITMAVVGKYRE